MAIAGLGNSTQVLDRSHWRGDTLGGLTAAITSLPLVIACGSIAFAPLGAEYVPLGIVAAMLGTILTSVVASIFCSCPIQVTGVRASLATVSAAMLATVVQTASPANALALLTVAGFVAGAFQILLGVFQVGRLIAYVPYPVIAGFMNGVAITLVVGQIKPALGIPRGSEIHNVETALALIRPQALVCAFVTVAVVMLGPRLSKKLPGTLQGMIFGVAAFGILRFWFPGHSPVDLVGSIPLVLPKSDLASGVRFVLGSPDLMPVVWQVLPIAFSLAFTGSIEALMNAATADATLGTCTNANRELFGQGLGNLASASIGGLLGSSSPLRTFAAYRGGGRTPLAGVAHAAWLLLFFVVLQPLISQLPIAVAAGVMIAVAVGMVDKWTQDLLWVALSSRNSGSWRAWANLGVVATVSIVVPLWGLSAAIVGGFLLSFALFLTKMMRQPVQRSFRCAEVRSKKIWAADDLAQLSALGNRVIVHCLQGEIFFGTIEPLARLLKQDLQTIDIAIVDFRRANGLDATGVRLLQQAHRDYLKSGKHLVVSGLNESHPAWSELRDLGALKEGAAGLEIFPDLDSALEWAERMQLSTVAARGNWDERLVDQIAYFAGLSCEQMKIIKEILRKHSYPAGSVVYAEGSSDLGVLFLAAGSVSIFKRIPNTTMSKRLAGIGPGKVVGEMAILTGRPRSADVVADEDIVGYELLKADFDLLLRTRPDIGVVILTNLGIDLATRLSVTSSDLVEQSGPGG